MDFEAAATHAVTVRVTDSGAASFDKTFAITLNNANDAPAAVADTVATAANTAVTVPVLANDTDPDRDTLTVTTAVDAANGSLALNADSTVTYTPRAGFVGTDSFTYTVSDGRGGTATGQVTVTVGAGSPVTLERRVVAGSDDAEERASGSVSLSSSDLELVDDLGSSSGVGQKVGLRFTGIEIPRGAVITKAYVQFQTDEVTSGASSLLIRGQDSDDAATFASTTGNVSTRPTTDPR
jgi:Bacterial Ig domain